MCFSVILLLLLLLLNCYYVTYRLDTETHSWLIAGEGCFEMRHMCQPIFFLFFIANQEKTSRKHIVSNASSNPETRKDSLPLGTTINESSLLLEVRNCMTYMCVCVSVCETLTHDHFNRKLWLYSNNLLCMYVCFILTVIKFHHTL